MAWDIRPEDSQSGQGFDYLFGNFQRWLHEDFPFFIGMVQPHDLTKMKRDYRDGHFLETDGGGVSNSPTFRSFLWFIGRSICPHFLFKDGKLVSLIKIFSPTAGNMLAFLSTVGLS